MTAPAQIAPPQAPNGGKGDAPIALKPFRVGVQEVDEEVYDEQRQLGASVITLPQYNVPSTAFLNALYIWIELTGDNTDAVVDFAPNGVARTIETIQITDTGGNEIIGPVTGWDIQTIAKWGGYLFNDDPRANSDVFFETTGAGATAGSARMILRVPLLIVGRDALGSLPNKSSSTPFKVKIKLAALSEIFTVAPNDTGVVARIRIMPDSYWEPTDTDGSGNQVAQYPPAVNTTQYWNVTPYEVNAGNFTQLLNNSVGFPVRNLGFVLDQDEVRADGETDWPEIFYLQLQSNLIIQRYNHIWQKKMAEWYDYGPVGEGAGQRDYGLYWQPYCADFVHKPGWENRRGYLKTVDGMRMNAKGNIGGSGSHTLTVLTNFIGIGAGSSLAAVTT